MSSGTVTPNESDAEDQPRNIFDLDGDFVIKDSDPPLLVKFNNSTPQVEGPDGRMVPIRSSISIRPVPKAVDVARVKAIMGQGENGVWAGTRFTSSEIPSFMFPVRLVKTLGPGLLERFCIRQCFVPEVSSLKTMMIYTDGHCSRIASGDNTPRGGCAFVFNHGSGMHFFSLENKGPDGQVYTRTANRAELRAVIGALIYRFWAGEGWTKVVIVTNSEYVARGATEWLRVWPGRDWRTSGGDRVANKDLWEELSEVMGSYAEAGCEISFWTVPEESNIFADTHARGATLLKAEDEYVNYMNTRELLL